MAMIDGALNLLKLFTVWFLTILPMQMARVSMTALRTSFNDPAFSHSRRKRQRFRIRQLKKVLSIVALTMNVRFASICILIRRIQQYTTPSPSQIKAGTSTSF
jgi:hypothetical protein